MIVNKRQIIIYIVFGISILYGINFHFFSDSDNKKKTKTGTSPAVYTQAKISSPIPNQAIQQAQPMAVNAESMPEGWGRDPFVAPAEQVTNLQSAPINKNINGDLSLSGISYYSDSESFAIINGRILQKGDSLDGWKIVRIDLDRVVVAGSEGTRQLVMGEKL